MTLLNGFMRIVFLFVFLVSYPHSTVLSEDKTEIVNRKPIIYFDESSAWPIRKDTTIWQLNSINPDFVLYDDGLVIFKKDEDQFDLYSVQLTKDEMNGLLEKFNIGDDFMKLEDSYSTNNLFDQLTYLIKYWQNSKMKRVLVSGPIRDSEKDRENTPPAFLELFDQIISFTNKDAPLWQPEKVEIHLYSFEDSQGEPVPWPKKWPDLNHPTTKKNADEWSKYSYTIYLDGEKKDELEEMFSSLKEEQAVLINEKPWYIAPKRYILPSEEMWEGN